MTEKKPDIVWLDDGVDGVFIDAFNSFTREDIVSIYFGQIIPIKSSGKGKATTVKTVAKLMVTPDYLNEISNNMKRLVNKFEKNYHKIKKE